MNNTLRNTLKMVNKSLSYFGKTATSRAGCNQPPCPHPTTIEDLIADLDEKLSSIPPRFRSRLISMFRGEAQIGTDGQLHTMTMEVKISPEQGLWMYELCVALRPAATIEIGMAYGYSTIFFLAAIENNRKGHHTSIDPYQHNVWNGIGLSHVQALVDQKPAQSHFTLVEDRSDRVAVDLARSQSSFDIIFIDGNHRFDDVLVDFYLYAPLCAINGHIIFDDMWMDSVQTVASFVRENRADFVEVQTSVTNISVFKRIGVDTREWNHFLTFSVSQSVTEPHNSSSAGWLGGRHGCAKEPR